MLFGISIVVFSLVGFFSDTFLSFMRDMQKFGISSGMAFRLIALQLPATIALVIPASTFLAVLLVYSAMSQHLEIIAMRLSGISLRRLIVPALILGVTGTVITYVLNDYVVPYCNTLTEHLKQDALRQGNLPTTHGSFMLKEFDDNHRLKTMVYVAGVNGRRLKGSTIIKVSGPETLQVIQAQGGRWQPGQWTFLNANAYTIQRHSETLAFNHLGSLAMSHLFEAPDQDTGLGEAGLRVDSDTMDFATLARQIKKAKQAGKDVLRITQIKMWEKLTLPLSCLVIVLTAVPLALTPPRTQSNRGFVFGVVVLFGYYLLRSISVALGRMDILMLGGLLSIEGAIAVAAWMPILVMLAIGLMMLQRKSQRI